MAAALLCLLHLSLIPAQIWDLHAQVLPLGSCTSSPQCICDRGHWLWSCSPGPVLAAKQEMTLSDTRNIKLPQRVTTLEHRALGRLLGSHPCPSQVLCWELQVGEAPPSHSQSFPVLFLYNYFSRKAHLANAGTGKPLCTDFPGDISPSHRHTPLNPRFHSSPF